MNGLQVEERDIKAVTSLSGDIAKTLMERVRYGSTIVVSKQPLGLLSSTRKQWLEEVRRLEKARASTVIATKIKELTQRLGLIYQIKMAVVDGDDDPNIDVGFMTLELVTRRAPLCHTVIVATPTDKEALHKLTAFMPADGRVIIYKA